MQCFWLNVDTGLFKCWKENSRAQMSLPPGGAIIHHHKDLPVPSWLPFCDYSYILVQFFTTYILVSHTCNAIVCHFYFRNAHSSGSVSVQLPTTTIATKVTATRNFYYNRGYKINIHDFFHLTVICTVGIPRICKKIANNCLFRLFPRAELLLLWKDMWRSSNTCAAHGQHEGNKCVKYVIFLCKTTVLLYIPQQEMSWCSDSIEGYWSWFCNRS